jgi:hypothetical protein
MTAQRTSNQAWETFFPNGAPLEIRSGVYKVFTRSKGDRPLLYLYYSRADNKWYDANGVDYTRWVVSFTREKR